MSGKTVLMSDKSKFNNQGKYTKDEFYIGEDGYLIFTEKYHLKRGYCCKSGCRHCPYNYDKKTDSFNKKD